MGTPQAGTQSFRQPGYEDIKIGKEITGVRPYPKGSPRKKEKDGPAITSLRLNRKNNAMRKSI